MMLNVGELIVCFILRVFFINCVNVVLFVFKFLLSKIKLLFFNCLIKNIVNWFILFKLFIFINVDFFILCFLFIKMIIYCLIVFNFIFNFYIVINFNLNFLFLK